MFIVLTLKQVEKCNYLVKKMNNDNINDLKYINKQKEQFSEQIKENIFYMHSFSKNIFTFKLNTYEYIILVIRT